MSRLSDVLRDCPSAWPRASLCLERTLGILRRDHGPPRALFAERIPVAVADGPWISARIGPTGYRVDVQAGGHSFVVDEPVPLGGTDAGATPYDYLLGALSGCMAITLRMYAD